MPTEYQMKEKARIPYVLGAGVQVLQPIEFKLDEPCRGIIIAFERVVTAAPANDPMLPGIVNQIEMQLNNNVIVPAMTMAQYIAVVQSLEMYQPQTISNGLIVPKMFTPPIQMGTQVRIQLTLNTLALSHFTAPPGAGAGVLKVYAVGAKQKDPAPSSECIYYKSLPVIANAAANTLAQIILGVDARRIIKFLLTELTAGALSDTCLGEVELNGDSNRIARLGTAVMKEMYRSEANQAVPAGYYMFKPPTPISANKYQTLTIDFDMHTATVGAALSGWEVYLKSYIKS